MMKKEPFRYFCLFRSIVTLFFLFISLPFFSQQQEDLTKVLVKEGVVFYVQDTTIIANAKIIYLKRDEGKDVKENHGTVYVLGNTTIYGLNYFKNAEVHHKKMVSSEVKISKNTFKEKKVKASYKINSKNLANYTSAPSEQRFKLLIEKYAIAILSNNWGFKLYFFKENNHYLLHNGVHHKPELYSNYESKPILEILISHYSRPPPYI